MLISHPIECFCPDSRPPWATLELYNRISKILKEAGVKVERCDFVKQYHVGTDAETVPFTLVTWSDLSIDSQYSCWVTATARLRNLFDMSGLGNILIEIFDQKSSYWSWSHPILSCNPDLISKWEGFIPTLLAEIEDRDWLAIDVVEREFGIKAPFRVPTIVVTTKDADNELWGQKIIPRLRTHLPDPFHIEVLYASALSRLASSGGTQVEPVDSDNIIDPIFGICTTSQNYSSCVEMGASIGLDKIHNSGSVGVGIKIRDKNGNETIYGLTCHHVVGCDGSLIQKHCPVGQFLSPEHPVCKDGLVKVVAPSHPDHERFSKFAHNHARSLTNRVKRLVENGMQEISTFKMWTSRLELANDDLKVVRSNPDRSFGTVWATSGYRVCTNPNFSSNEVKDMSVVGTQEETDPKVKHSPCSQTRIGDRSLSFGLNWALLKIVEARKPDPRLPFPFQYECALQYTRIEKDQSYKVMKRGRTTGVTKGRINAIRSILKIQKNQDDKVNIIPVDLSKRFGAQDGIFLAYGIFDDRDGHEFMLGGDSGSCVLLQEKEDCRKLTNIGLLFASNEYTRVSYMMPIDMVINDIEHVTGHTVTEPKFVEYADRLE